MVRSGGVRRAFTLVEMLVAITIFAILAAIAISAFSETGSDRVPAAARQFRAMLTGAQSRAVKDGAPRGLRLYLDPNRNMGKNELYATSLGYIGTTDTVEGKLNGQTLSAMEMVMLYPSGVGWRIEQDSSDLIQWSALISQSKIVVGNRISLAWADSSLDFYIQSITGSQLVVVGPEPPPSIGKYPTSGTEPTIRYKLELAPEVLPNTTAAAFPQGTVIDLNASLLPQASLTTCISNGHLDIMFTERGGLLGTVDSRFFYIGQLEDSARDRESAAEWPEVVPPDPPPHRQIEGRVINTEPLYPQRVVSIVSSTGQVLTGEYIQDAANEAAPFAIARFGKEAK